MSPGGQANITSVPPNRKVKKTEVLTYLSINTIYAKEATIFAKTLLQQEQSSSLLDNHGIGSIFIVCLWLAHKLEL